MDPTEPMSNTKNMKRNDSQNSISLSLRPKARIIKTLGEELISSETVALIELVKNSYDADAKNVLISFTGNLQVGEGQITVLDDGHGMDMKTIHDSWMTIATSIKRTNKKSKSGKRRVLGEKGIGRFASSRIANELELFTRTAKQVGKESYAIFDWTQFDNDDIYLDEVLFLAEEKEATEITSEWKLSKFAKYRKPYKGTALKMNGLKHNWEKRDLEDLQRGLSRLISPFKSIHDFNIFLDLPEEHCEFSAKISAPDIIKYPHYVVKGDVKADGKYEFSVSVEADSSHDNFSGYYYKSLTNTEWKIHQCEEGPELKINDKNNKSIECGPFSFELQIWDRDELDNVNQKIGGGIRNIRKDLDSIAGINIYRDGFRVLPYGEPDNDWLRLDIRRVQKPTWRLSNNQITGYIAITANQNPLLHDRSNREGLDNNSAYADLQKIMMEILIEVENLRYSYRHKKSNVNEESGDQKSLFDSPDFESIIKQVKDDDTGKDETISLITQMESDWKKQISKIKKVLSQYHALATLGAIIDKILHDGRQPLSKIQTEAGLGMELAEDLIQSEYNTTELSKFRTGYKKIVDQSSILRDVFRRVEPFGGRKKGRPKKYYIEDLIKDMFSTYESELKAASIKIELPDDSSTLVSVDKTELSEVLMNLITNSLYWLKSVPQERRNIHVQIKRQKDSSLELIFSDSGPGIPSRYKDQIFEPYFSRKPDGHGLGLCLVGEIVKDYYNGSVELMDTGSNGGASFRIILRKRV